MKNSNEQNIAGVLRTHHRAISYLKNALILSQGRGQTNEKSDFADFLELIVRARDEFDSGGEPYYIADKPGETSLFKTWFEDHKDNAIQKKFFPDGMPTPSEFLNIVGKSET